MLRKKMTVSLIVLMTLFLFTGGAWAQQNIKIGIIDFQRVLRESKGGKAAKEEIETKGRSMEQNLKSEGEELEQLKKKLDAERLVISRDKMEDKEREFRIRINDFKERQEKYAKEFKQYELGIIKRIQKEVFDLVENIGKQGNFDLILEKGGVLYHTDTIDITGRLIKAYDAIK